MHAQQAGCRRTAGPRIEPKRVSTQPSAQPVPVAHLGQSYWLAFHQPPADDAGSRRRRSKASAEYVVEWPILGRQRRWRDNCRQQAGSFGCAGAFCFRPGDRAEGAGRRGIDRGRQVSSTVSGRFPGEEGSQLTSEAGSGRRRRSPRESRVIARNRVCCQPIRKFAAGSRRFGGASASPAISPADKQAGEAVPRIGARIRRNRMMKRNCC